jgi:pSer/pThr/pTyr-binding forkhead associated (FHA) protein
VFEVTIKHKDESYRRQRTGPHPIIVGRDPACELATADSSVSRRHAMLWEEAGKLLIRDLGSANGTWRDTTRILGPVDLAPGDRVRVGLETTLDIRELLASTPDRNIPLLEHIGTRTLVPVLGPIFTISNDSDADFWVSDAPHGSVSVVVQPSGALRLRHAGHEVYLPKGEEFSVGDRRFRVTDILSTMGSTLSEQGHGMAYRLSVGLDPDSTAWGEISWGVGNRRYHIRGGNKALLLYLLGRPHIGIGPPASPGHWVSDETILTGIWGRAGDLNKLYVLIHRLRTDIGGVGLDGDCIEKRTGATRIHLGSDSETTLT